MTDERLRALRTRGEAALVAAARRPPLATAIAMIGVGRLADAETIVRRHLETNPGDLAGLCILGDLAVRAGVLGEATRLFQRALAAAPWLAEARLKLARVLAQSGAAVAALAEYDQLVADDPHDKPATVERLVLMAQLGQYREALAGYEVLLSRAPEQARLWLAYGNLLKTVDRAQDSTAAFRRALSLNPHLGEAWWGLANLKFTKFEAADKARLEQLLASSPNDRLQTELHFTLGRILEQEREFEASFHHYARGNEARRRTLPYDAGVITTEVDRWIATLTSERIVARASAGSQSTAPVFVLGMPRAGSTLVEQILASHPLVEGTAELPVVPAMVNALWEEGRNRRFQSFPELLDNIAPARLADLGETYLRGAAAYRVTDRPYFIDKLPNNWINIGLIHQMLPNAKIVDVRRAPIACCFANFKQHFATGQGFSNSLHDMATYYRDYVRLMAHIDAVLPECVYRVSYELLVADPEQEIRRLLDALGLPFHPACLTPHRTTRAVRTASAEQVRRPITRDAVESWRDYAPWLEELRDGLGDLAEP